jgi:osmotically-inducible protein OsmY
MKNIIIFTLCLLLLVSCVGSSSTGIFGSGVSIALDPRTLGTQIDDSIMQKNLAARIILLDKKYLIDVSTKVLDGRIFVTGKVDEPEEKLKITKMAWETKGVRSVKNDIRIKVKFNFKNTAKDILITSQLRAAMIFNNKINSANYNLDTINSKIYIYGIALDEDERREVIQEAKEVLDVKDVIGSILLVSDLSRQKN